ncbi:MAG: PASTA domain-containing protein [Acidimicrobiales bacterium]
MSDQGPTDPDPTRPIPQTGGQPAADDPTSVVRTERTEASGRTLPPEPPREGGVSTGLAIGAALVVGLLGLLIGFVIFDGGDDDAEVDETAEVDDAAAEEEAAAMADVEAERDELAGQVEDLTGQVEDLQTQLDEVTAERDELQAQLDEGDAVETTPAPDVTGASVEDARTTASDNDWEIFERDAENPPADAEPGTVVEQSPAPDTPMVEGSVLVVHVVPEPDE